MNYHMNSSISSQSTQTSSVFSQENEDYDARIREIEEYYIKTLLSEDSEDDGVSKQQSQFYSQLQTQLPGYYAHQMMQGSQVFSGAEIGQQQQQQQQAYVQPQSWFKKSFLDTQYQDPWPQKVSAKEPSLEVEINSQYRPSNGIMPLTTENLRMIQEKAEEAPELLAEPSKAEPSKVHQAPAPVTATAQSQAQQTHSKVHSEREQPEKVNKQLYKTELCESFATRGTCKYGNKCQFAHGLHELKLKQRSTNFRTKPCVNWQKHGYCRYGKRCCFKHGDDEDIQIYMQAGVIKKIEDQPVRKNLHADVRALQKMTW